MGKVKIPYYVVKRGKGFWQPKPDMRAHGFSSIPCGPDGPDAWKIAQEWNERWQRYRRGESLALREAAASASVAAVSASAVIYPKGSLGEAFARYRKLTVWDEKAPRTREDWWRGWRYIAPVFGDVSPATITLEDVDSWRARVRQTAGDREAHRATKIWRALWTVAQGFAYTGGRSDPSLVIPNSEAEARSEVWTQAEVVRLVRTAWRNGYRGLAAAIAIAWDTQLSPVDVRLLTARQVRFQGDGTAVVSTSRAKTGEAVTAFLSRHAGRVVKEYLARANPRPMGDAVLVMSRGFEPGKKGGRPRPPAPYTKDLLGDEFRAVRALAFGNAESRQLQDMRRSGAVEAIAGGATAEQLSHAMANTLSASNKLFKTYAPNTPATSMEVHRARRQGRQRIRDGNETS